MAKTALNRARETLEKAKRRYDEDVAKQQREAPTLRDSITAAKTDRKAARRKLNKQAVQAATEEISRSRQRLRTLERRVREAFRALNKADRAFRTAERKSR